MIFLNKFETYINIIEDELYDCCRVQSKHRGQTRKCVSLNAGDLKWVFPENRIK